MASLLDWLGGQIEGGFAQINPFDNGETYDSVQKRRQREQQVAQQRQQQQAAPAQNQIAYGGFGNQQRTTQQPQAPRLSIADVSKASVATQKPAPQKPLSLIDEFNNADVHKQRQILADVKNRATRRDFNTAQDVEDTEKAKLQVEAIEKLGKKKEGNPLTFIEDFAKMTGDTYGRVMQANARVLDDLTVGSQRSLDNARQQTLDTMQKNRQQLLRNAAASPFVNPNDDPRVKQIDSKIKAQQATMDATRAKIMDEADPFKYAGASGSVVLDAATLGAGAPLLQGVKSPVAVKGVQSILNPQGIVQGIKSGAVLGTGYGATNTLEQLGSNAQPLDYLQNMAIGGALGGVTGGALPIAGKGVREVSTRTRNLGLKPPTNLTPDELMATTRVVDANSNPVNPVNLTDADMALYYQAQQKLGTRPGTPDGHQAVVNALNAHRAFDVEVNKRKLATVGALQKASQLTQQRMIPGGTLAGSNARGFAQAQQAGRVFDGVDGKPRFEVDDSGAKLSRPLSIPGLPSREFRIADKAVKRAYNQHMKGEGSIDEYGRAYRKLQDTPKEGTHRLEKVLNHKELYAQYPELKNARVIFKKMDVDRRGSADAKNGLIEINSRLSKEEQKSTLLHEVQHLVQNREGFAGGGSPEAMTSKNIYREGELEEWSKLSADKQFNRRKLSLQEEKRLSELDRKTTQYSAYRNLAGEAEARAVQARMNMTGGERKASKFYDSLDVPKEDLIIGNDGGVAMSVNDASSNSAKPDGAKATKSNTPEQRRLREKQADPTTQGTSNRSAQLSGQKNPLPDNTAQNGRTSTFFSAFASSAAESPSIRNPARTSRLSESRQSVSRRGESSPLKMGETSTSPKSVLQQKTTPAVQGTYTKALTKSDRSYVDNTTEQVKKRGFTHSVKGSDEVSSDVRRKVSGKYNVRSTDKLALSADDFSKGNLRKATDNVNERLDVKRGKITDQDVADALAVAKRLDAQQHFDQSQAIYDKLAEHGTASGQTIQAFSLLKNRTPDGIKYQMVRELKKAGVNLTDADQKEVGKLIDRVRKTKVNTEARNRALFDTMDYVAKRIPSNNGDKIVNFWRAGLLTAPKTTGGNIIGNTTELASRELWANPVAIATDKFFSMFTGKRTKTFSGGQVAGMKEGVEKGWDFMKTGYDPRNVQSKWDAPRRINYKNKVIDKYVNGVYRWMGTQDQPFYYGAKAAAAYDMAKADGMNLKLKGQELAEYVEKSVADENWKPQTFKTAKDVEQYARYAVYQNDTLLANMARGIKNEAGKKNMRWLTDFVLPFTQVPSSIAMRVIDRTPIGTAREVVSQIRKGSFDQRAMAEAIGNGSFGIPVVAAGYALSQAGEITGDYPTDSKERKLWEEEGKQPYSVRIGDKWYSLNYLQPFGTIMSIGKNLDDQKKAGKSDSEAWMTAVGSAGQSVTDQSFLKGLNGVLSALNDPDRSLGQFAKSTAGSTIPNFIRSFATATDDKQRETKDPAAALQGSVPVLRQSLPEKQGMFGNTLERRDDAVNSYLNPLRPSRAKNEDDPLLKELRRLQDSGNGIVTTDFSKNSIKDVELTDEQIRDLNKQVNSQVQVEWNKAVKDGRYAALSDEDKNTVLKRIKDNVSNAVKADFVKQNSLATTAKYKVSSKSPFTTSNSKVEINTNIAGDYKSTLEKYDSLNEDDRKKWFNTENDAEYKYKEAKYKNDKANGTLSAAQDIKAQKELRKEKVGSKYAKNVRDLHSLSKADLADYLALEEKGVDKKKIAEDLLKYDRELYDSGAASSLKFKYGFGSGSKGGRKGGRKGKGTAQAKAFVSLTGSINKQMAGNAPKTTGSSAPTTGLKLPQLQKTALKKYSVKSAKVQKGARQTKIKTSKA